MAVSVIKGTEVKVWLDDEVIGRASSVTLRLANNVETYHELGERDAVEVIEKTRNISGTLERAVINGMLLAKAYTTTSLSGSTYSIASGEYQNPAATVTDESITADDAQTVFELDYNNLIVGTVTIKQDGSAWGTEGIHYVIDYPNALITFASPPSSGNTWTVDYTYGRSYTITAVAQVGDGNTQRTDIEVSGLLFDTWEVSPSNSGDVVKETMEFVAKHISGITLGLPNSGV